MTTNDKNETNKLFQSVAIVLRTDKNQTSLLLRRQPEPLQWKFVVGERLNRESFRESITREVAWQLNLNRKSDFLVSNMAALSIDHVETGPDGSPQLIALAFYNVHIYRGAVLETLSRDASNRWVSAAETCQGKTIDGQTIDPRVVSWINKWSVVQPWQ